MLQINENELVMRYRQPGGADWVGFVNNLLWAACWQMGIPESAVRTVLRTEIGDGGVDTRIELGSAKDTTGYLSGPTVPVQLKVEFWAKEKGKSCRRNN